MQQNEVQSTINSLLSLTKNLCEIIPSCEPESILAILDERQQLLYAMEQNRTDVRAVVGKENSVVNEILTFDETLCYLLEKKKNEVSAQIAILNKRKMILNYQRQEAV